jgi:hypothetical protein
MEQYIGKMLTGFILIRCSYHRSIFDAPDYDAQIQKAQCVIRLLLPKSNPAAIQIRETPHRRE